MGTTDSSPFVFGVFQPRPSGRGQQPWVSTIGLQRLPLALQNIVQRAGKMFASPNPPRTSTTGPNHPFRWIPRASKRTSRVSLPVIEYPSRRNLRIDDAVHVVRPHVQPVQQPSAEGTNFDDRVSDQRPGVLRAEQVRLLLHPASTVSFQSRIGCDRTAFTVSTRMVKAAASIAGQPGAVASECDQIQHNEKCVERTIVLTSTLCPALTGAAG
jgi:hypothetical protein